MPRVRCPRQGVRTPRSGRGRCPSSRCHQHRRTGKPPTRFPACGGVVRAGVDRWARYSRKHGPEGGVTGDDLPMPLGRRLQRPRARPSAATSASITVRPSPSSGQNPPPPSSKSSAAWRRTGKCDPAFLGNCPRNVEQSQLLRPRSEQDSSAKGVASQKGREWEITQQERN